MFEDIDPADIASNDIFGVTTVAASDTDGNREADVFFTVKKPKSFFAKSSTKRELGGNVTESKPAAKVAKKHDERCDSMANNNAPTGADFRTRVAVTFQEKLAVLEERDRYLRSRVYVDNVKNMSVIAVGTCPDMCPEKERLLREIHCSFSVFEAQISNNEMLVVPEFLVKEYSRSSADQEEPLPHELRPEPVLIDTLRHLLVHVVPRIEDDVDQVDVGEWYHFCWDRLRSLRKDIIQQQLCSANIVQILECSARFHICCADILHATDVRVFDEKINTENLVNCLQMLFGLYDRLKTGGVESGCENEVEFRIYMALLLFEGAGDVSADVILGCGHDARAAEAVDLYVAFKLKLYSKFFKLVRATSYLNACILQRYFGRVRMHVLNALANAYSAGSHAAARFPLTFAKRALELSDDEETKAFVEAYGFAANDEEVRASKASFTIPETHPVAKSSAIVRRKRTSVLDAICCDDRTHQLLTRQCRPDVKVHSSFDADDVLRKDAWLADDQKCKVIAFYGDVYAGGDKCHESEVDDEDDDEVMDDDDHLVDDESTSEVEEILQTVSDASNVWKSPLLSSSFGDGAAYVDDKCELDEEEDEKDVDEADELPSETVRHPRAHMIRLAPVPAPVQSTFSFAQPATEMPSVASSPNVETVTASSRWVTSPAPQATASQDEIDTAACAADDANADASDLYDPTQPLCDSPPTVASEYDESYSPSKSSFDRSAAEQHDRSVEQIYESLTQQLSQFDKLYFNEDTAPCYDAKTEARRLRRVIRRRLKRKSALKYGRLWRKKVLAARKRRDEFVGVTHLSFDDYFRLWGDVAGVRDAPLAARDGASSTCALTTEMLVNEQTRRWSSSLLSGSAVKLPYLGERLSHTVARAAQKTTAARLSRRPTRICWKAVVSLPAEEGGDGIRDAFETRVRELCRTLYYPADDRRLGDVVAQKCADGTTVYTSVNVAVGASSTRGLSYVLLVVNESWERWHELESRLDSIFDGVAYPVAMSVAVIGECSYRSQFESYLAALKRRRRRVLLEWRPIEWRNLLSVSEAFTAAYVRRVPPTPVFEVQTMAAFVRQMGVEFFARLRAVCRECANSPVVFVERYNRFVKLLSAAVRDQNANYYNLAPEFVDAVVGGAATRTNLRADDLPVVEATVREYALVNFTKWPPKSTTKMEKLLVRYCARLDDDGHTLCGRVMRAVEWRSGADVDAISDSAPWLQITEWWFEYNARRAANETADVVVFYEKQAMEGVIDDTMMEAVVGGAMAEAAVTGTTMEE